MVVWRKSMDVAVMIYALCQKLPKSELYTLQSQMKRAAVSIPSNIAEGQSRLSDKEFARFLSIAKGSRSELETHLQLCVRLGYLTEEDILEVSMIMTEISKMLATLIGKLTKS